MRKEGDLRLLCQDQFSDLPHHRGQIPHHIIIPKVDNPQPHRTHCSGPTRLDSPLPSPVWIDLPQKQNSEFPRSSFPVITRQLKRLVHS
jgi:hypothetical protein